MVIYGISLEKNFISQNFFIDVNKRLEKENIISNPFNDSFVLDIDKYYIIKMKSIYPNIFYLFLLPLIIGLIFNIVWLIITCSILFCFFGFFETKYFYFIMTYWGLRKEHYKGKIRLITDDELKDYLLNLAREKTK